MRTVEIPKTLHPMTIGDVLDRSIQLYRSNFLKFVGIVLLVKGPYLLLGYVFAFISAKSAAVLFPDMPYAFGENVAFSLIKLLELLFVGPVLIAAMTMAISERFLDRNIGITESYRRILKRFLPLVGTILLTGTIISIVLFTSIFMGMSMFLSGSQAGMLLVIFGGAFAAVLWIRYMFVSQTVVIEGEGGFSAMKRSKYLVKGSFLKAFVLLIVVFLAIALVTELAAFGLEKSLFFLGSYSVLLAQGLSNVLSVLLEPFRIATITLLYYDFRIRKEGFDLEIMAEELASEMESEDRY